MKKLISFISAFIVVFCFASCGSNNSSQQTSDLERREAEQRKQQETRDAVEKERAEENSFTTSIGTLDTEKVLSMCYQQGVHNYGLFGNPKDPTYDPEWRTEEKFKLFWQNNFGLPNNEKAKSIYQKGYKRYTEGWDDAANF